MGMKQDISKTEQRLRRGMAKAMIDYNMVEEGDRVMVAVSGGKDSYAMLHLLRSYQRRAPINFEIIAVHLDQAQPGYDGRPLVDYLERESYDYKILRQDTYSVVMDKVPEGKTYCSLCSRLRRGILYTTAVEMGCTKIALGHHGDDMVETFLLNMFFTGQLKAMPPKLQSDDGRNVVIRPLAYCHESDLIAFSEEKNFPILPCNLCGSQDNMRRQTMKEMVKNWEAQWPGTREVLLASLRNVRPSHLLVPDLWRALNLPIAGSLEPAASASSRASGASLSSGSSLADSGVREITDEKVREELGF